MEGHAVILAAPWVQILRCALLPDNYHLTPVQGYSRLLGELCTITYTLDQDPYRDRDTTDITIVLISPFQIYISLAELDETDIV